MVEARFPKETAEFGDEPSSSRICKSIMFVNEITKIYLKADICC